MDGEEESLSLGEELGEPQGSLVAAADELQVRMIADEGEQLYKCSHCKLSFKRISALKNHVQRNHSEELLVNEDGSGRMTLVDPVECIICQAAFSKKSGLEIHMKTHFKKEDTGNINQKPLKSCSITLLDCFLPKANVNGKEIMRSKRAKAYKCEYCEETLVGQARLEKHMQSHPGEKLYTCFVCCKKFTLASTLKGHLRTHTGEKPYQCEECKKRFRTSSSLGAHRRIHTGVKDHKCERCGKSFKRAPELRRHIRTHTGERPYACEVCEAKFGNRTSLKIHMRVHTSERPYKCRLCDSFFQTSSQEGRHFRTAHTKERPYQCIHCTQCFAFPDRLRAHMKVHTDEKPFECDICGKKFRYKSNMTSHSHQHNVMEIFECEICNTTFTERGELELHLCTDESKPDISHVTVLTALEEK